jgi:hypothetical protein
LQSLFWTRKLKSIKCEGKRKAINLPVGFTSRDSRMRPHEMGRTTTAEEAKTTVRPTDSASHEQRDGFRNEDVLT